MRTTHRNRVRTELNSTAPVKRPGDVIVTRHGRAVILRSYGAGTIDVETADGSCYRITGLSCVEFPAFPRSQWLAD